MRQHSLEAYGGLVRYLYYISSSWMIGPSSLWLHYYLVPWYEVVLGTKYLEQGTGHGFLGTKYMVLRKNATQYSVHATYYLVSSTRTNSIISHMLLCFLRG